MAELGCEVGNNFSPQQLEAIELFAIGELNCGEVAQQLGITPQTISTWRKNEQFMDAIYFRTRKLLRDALPEIYKAARNKAKAGNAPHIRILLEHLDNIEKTISQKNQSSITFTWDTNADSNSI
jgi:hypothetical protein